MLKRHQTSRSDGDLSKISMVIAGSSCLCSLVCNATFAALVSQLRWKSLVLQIHLPAAFAYQFAEAFKSRSSWYDDWLASAPAACPQPRDSTRIDLLHAPRAVEMSFAWRLKVAIPSDLDDLPRLASIFLVVIGVVVWRSGVVLVWSIVPIVPPLFREFARREIGPRSLDVAENWQTL